MSDSDQEGKKSLEWEFLEWEKAQEDNELKSTYGTNAKTVQHDRLSNMYNAGTAGGGGHKEPAKSVNPHPELFTSPKQLFKRVPKKVLENPTSLRQIGTGSFGTVHVYNGSSEVPIAIKKLITSGGLQKKMVGEIMNEINLHAGLSHHNIIKYYGCYEAKQHISIVMEYAANGSLQKRLYDLKSKNKVLPEQTILDHTEQIVNGLSYIHNLANPIIHRDLKAANILLCKDNVAKLSDFGESKQLVTGATNSDTSGETIGTYLWMAPEMMKFDNNDKTSKINRGRRSDIWSLGITIVEMIYTAELPNSNMTEKQYLTFICVNKKVPEIPSRVTSTRLREIIQSCLMHNPTERCTANSMIQKFFTS